MSLPKAIIVNHPIYIVMKLFLYMIISMQTADNKPLTLRMTDLSLHVRN